MPPTVRLKTAFCLAAILFVWAQLLSPGLSLAATAEPGKTEQAYLYEHPRQGYLIGIPLNVDLQDRGDRNGIAIKSRKGYQVTVQTNATNPDTNLIGMLSRMESKYLGVGKPWARKFSQGATRVAGLTAIEAMYEGAGVRVRVIIARGSNLDYVFIFLASPLNFQKLVTEFDWIVANFKAAPGDLVNAPVANSDPENVLTFAQPGFGFSVRYPTDWVAERQGDHAVIISGKPGTPEYFATISFQNIKKPDAEQAVAATLQGLKNQIVAADSQAQISGEGPYVYTKTGARLQGGQFIVTYVQGETGYKQLTIVLPRPNEDIIHIWSYAAPIDSFLKYGDVARSVLNSWTLESGN